MKTFLKKVIGDKKAWNALEARSKQLPDDYGIVYNEIKQYMWNLWRFSASAGNEAESMATLEDLLNLFEAGAASGKGVLDVTGPDVAGFCDELFRATESWRARLNRDVMAKLAKKKNPRLS